MNQGIKKIRALIKAFNDVDKDPESRKFAEEHHKRIGTLSAEDLRKEFTI